MDGHQPPAHSPAYFNVMEVLVAEEINRQLRAISYSLAQYLNQDEIATFALNRLPPLYAASKKGVAYQHAKAHRELRQSITQTVRQAFAAVQRDLLRTSPPLQIATPLSKADMALALLRETLQRPHLTWDEALKILANRTQPQGQGSCPAPPKRPAAPPMPIAGYAKQASELNSTALRPGVYGCRTTWIPKQRHTGQ